MGIHRGGLTMRRTGILVVCLILVACAAGQLGLVQAGGCVGMPDGEPCTPDGIECTLDECRNEVCVHPLAPEGTACGGIAPACHQNVCDVVGICLPERLPDGAACFDDGNPCTADSCMSGFCTHGSLSDGSSCPDEGNDCTEDYCQSGFCTHPPAPDGAACSGDGNDCTDDVCLGGICDHACLPEGTECPLVPGRLGACKLNGGNCGCVDRGRCCLANGCTDLLQDACNLQGGAYGGDGTSCNIQNVRVNQTKAVMTWTPTTAPSYDLTWARVVPATSFNGNFGVFVDTTGGSCVFGCGTTASSYTIGCKGAPAPGGMDMWLVRERGGACTGSWDEKGNQRGTRDTGAMGVPASVCP